MDLQVFSHLGQLFGGLRLELGNSQMRWTSPRGRRLRGVWRSVPRPSLAITGLPAVPAISAVPGKALGAV